jgi:hypothetical protein
MLRPHLALRRASLLLVAERNGRMLYSGQAVNHNSIVDNKQQEEKRVPRSNTKSLDALDKVRLEISSDEELSKYSFKHPFAAVKDGYMTKAWQGASERGKRHLESRMSMINDLELEELYPYLVEESDLRWTTSTRGLWHDILDGKEMEAWRKFNHMILISEEGGQGETSIWDWYIMIGLIARDVTVPIEDAINMAYFGQDYESSIIFRSLKVKDETGSVLSQQQVLAFALMSNFNKRMTDDGFEGALSVWDTFMQRCAVPTTRLINMRYAALIHLHRMEEAIQEFVMMAQTSDREGEVADSSRVKVYVNDYTISIMMHAFLLEELPKYAYGLFKIATGSLYRVSPSSVNLTLLLVAARQAQESFQIAKQMELEENVNFDSLAEEKAKWESQTMWDGIRSPLQARSIAKMFLFHHHPELKEVKNPLYDVDSGSQAGFMWKAHTRIKRWTSSLTSSQVDNVEGDSTITTTNKKEAGSKEQASAMDFNDNFFSEYLRLLPLVNIYHPSWEEFLLVLAWMKKLDIKPDHYSLLRMCWAIDNLVSPAEDFADTGSAAGPLHSYLADWIGEHNIPTREEVGRFVMGQIRGAPHLY